MKFVDVQFSDFIPDRAGTPWPSDPGYLVDAEDIYPTPNGWRAYAAATNVAAATAVPSTSGADIEAAFIERNGTTANIFAMTDTTWFQSNDLGVTWNNVTPATAVGAVSGWERFDDLVVITPFGGQPREKDITGTVTAQFSDLTGFSGGAVDVGRIRDHLFIATTAGVRWSSIGDPQDYPTPGGASALASQAGSETLPGQLGQTRAVCGGEKFGVVFQQRGISRFTYVGGDVVYTVDTFEKNIGLGDGQALAVKRVGDLFYFTNYEGVFVTDGYSVRRLSYGQIDESLFTGLVSSSDSFVPSLLSTQSIAVDFARDCVLFAPDGYGKLIGCNYRLNKFFTLSDTTLISLLAGPSGSSYSDYQLLGFDSSQKLRQFTAAPSANLQTGFMELVPGRRVRILGAHLLGSNYGSPTLAYKAADDPADIDGVQTGFTSMTAANRDLMSATRDTARFFAFRVTGISDAQGFLWGMRVFFEPVST